MTHHPKNNHRTETTDANVIPDTFHGTVYTCPMHPEVRRAEPGDCPKCNMHLVPEGSEETQRHSHEHGHGHGGRSASVADPKTEVKGGTYDKVPDGYDGAVYTCPMHAEVRQTKPGSCPICGMGLELESAAMVEDGPNPELVDFTRRFWVGAVLTVPLLVLTMSPYVGAGWIREIFGEPTTPWIEFALGTPVILWSGWPFFTRGWTSFRTMKLNMFSLIAMGIAAML